MVERAERGERREVKRVFKIFLRVLGVALVVFVLSQIQYRDRYVADGASPLTGRVLVGDAGDVFEVRKTGEKFPLHADWRAGPQDGVEVKLGLFTIVLESDKLLLVIFAFLFGPISLISITRWWYLLKRVEIPIPFWEAFRLTFIGLFFNSAVPGLTGGDLVKALYIARRSEGARIRAAMSVLMDRAIGLFALGLLSAMVLVPNLGDPTFRPAATIVFLFLGAATLFGATFLSGRLRSIVRLDQLMVWLRKKRFGLFLAEVDQSIVIYRKVPGAVFTAVLLSLLNHFSLVVMAIGLGRALGMTLPAMDFFILVPVCMMMASIPLLPGGWGVREAAFAAFFGMAGVPVTQSVALSIIIGLTQLAWSLLGGVFFLARPDRASSRDLADFSQEMEERTTEVA